MKEKRTSKEKTFEESLARLEEIISEMEKGNHSLEARFQRLQEGYRLANFCSAKLDEFEKKIEVLAKKADGSFETQEFPMPGAPLPNTGASEADEDQKEGAIEKENDEQDEPLF